MSEHEDHKREVFMAIAYQLAELGTCDRKRVGAVIVRDGRCITWGYNGAPPGLPHCDENYHGHKGPITNPAIKDPQFYWEQMANTGCINSTHAEANALAFAARQGISTDEATLFVTVSPCEVCARLLIAAGIKAVYYSEAYRYERGLELLKQAGVLVYEAVYA